MKKTILLLFLAGAFTVSQAQMRGLYSPVFPHFAELVPNAYGFQDAAFIVAGFRALAADVAWVQLLQTMGESENAENGAIRFPLLKNDTLRVTRIDPFFTRAYLFGAATLAWLQNTNRPDEALEVLAEGIKYNPRVWEFRTYAAGIGYLKTNQMQNMIRMLEDAVRDPGCPSMVKSILANSYKSEKRYADAIVMWENILASPDAREYHQRAREEIPKLRALMGA